MESVSGNFVRRDLHGALLLVRRDLDQPFATAGLHDPAEWERLTAGETELPGRGRTARVVLREPVTIEYMNAGAVDAGRLQPVGSPPASDAGGRLRTVWIPEDETLLSEVEVSTLWRPTFPSRSPTVPTTRSTVLFYHLGVNAEGRVVFLNPVHVDQWDQ